MLFENNDYNFDVLSLAGFDITELEKLYNENSSKLYETNEGFLKGNMWKEEYAPYKNYSCQNLKPTCEREALLFKIMELNFAINDLNLYLDIHPEDCESYEKLKMCTKEYLKLKDSYANKYGPLTIEQTVSSNYEWLKNPWPWDKKGGSMYV